MLTRRLALATGLLFATLAAAARADALDPRMAPRALGAENAKVTVEEWFSFTCPHCAKFAADVYPQIKTKLIDTGKIRYIFREYPRDRVDLQAAMVARSLPPSRYEPFVLALLSSQQQWAFKQGADPTEELEKMAVLAGMARTTFEQAIEDESLQQGLLDAQRSAEQKYNIDSTPTFIVNGVSHPGELSLKQFEDMVAAVK